MAGLRRDSTAAVDEPLAAALFLGIPWATIHLFLQLPGQMNEGLEPVPTFVSLLGYSVILTWAFVASGGSVLLVALIHAGLNGVAPLMAGLEVDRHGLSGPSWSAIDRPRCRPQRRPPRSPPSRPGRRRPTGRGAIHAARLTIRPLATPVADQTTTSHRPTHPFLEREIPHMNRLAHIALVLRERRIQGTICYTGDDYRAVIALMAQGHDDTTGWVDTIPISGVLEQGFEELRAGRKMKLLVDPTV